MSRICDENYFVFILKLLCFYLYFVVYTVIATFLNVSGGWKNPQNNS
jgi:hypothetical protein